jgi:hypothetical protein
MEVKQLAGLKVPLEDIGVDFLDEYNFIYQ